MIIIPTKQNENAPAHLFIENPINGKQINILPILSLQKHFSFGMCQGIDNSLYANMDRTIRFLATLIPEETFFEEIREMLDVLYEIRDAFGNVTEFKSPSHEGQ